MSNVSKIGQVEAARARSIIIAGGAALTIGMAVFAAEPAGRSPVKWSAEEWTPEALPPIETVVVGKRGELLVNGQPFIPLCSWAQAVSRLPMLHGLGINAFACNHSRKPPAREFCDLAKAAGGYAVPEIEEGEAAAKGHPALLMYLQEDEPDLNMTKDKPPKMSAEKVVEVYQEIKAKDNTRPVWVGFTAMFMTNQPASEKISQEQRDSYYPKAIQGADFLHFDIYPIYGWNRPDQLTWVADGVTQLRKIAGGRPIGAAIETCKGSQWITYEKQKDVLPEHTRAEVWMALIRGARAITYFTHAWRPQFSEFACTPEMRKMLKEINLRVTRLTPELCAEPSAVKVAMTMEGGLDCHFAATEHQGFLVVFAQNLDMQGRAGKATIAVPGLAKGTPVEVVGEGRMLTADAGGFGDDFAPLIEHVYRVKQP